MTNFEHIKSMNEEEFTNFMQGTNLDKCWCEAKSNCHLYDSCSKAFIDWLKSEHIKD